MTYKAARLRLETGWVLEPSEGSPLVLDEVLRLLAAIDASGHIAGACRACGVSYRHGWGSLRKAEAAFGQALLQTSRRQGSTLTSFARTLLGAKQRTDARSAPLFEAVLTELHDELDSYYAQQPARLRLHASHGFAVEELMQMMASSDSPAVELRYRTATEALAALSRDACEMAGFQVPLGRYQEAALQHYLPLLNPSRHALVYLATRQTGLFVPAGNPKNICSLADLAKPEVRFVNRQTGSGTRLLLSLMLDDLGIDSQDIDGYDSSEFTHMAIAAHVASGMADVGIGVETAAWRCGLGFIPLARERYFFAVQREQLDTVAMRSLFSRLSGKTYQTFLSQLVGYDARGAGAVLGIHEAFQDDQSGSADAGRAVTRQVQPQPYRSHKAVS